MPRATGVDIDESDVDGLMPGEPVTFEVRSYPDDVFGSHRNCGSAWPADGHDHGRRGLDGFAGAGVVTTVVSYTAIIDVANPDQRLRPGMTAEVTLDGARQDRRQDSERRARVPSASAVLQALGGGTVVEAATHAGDRNTNAQRLDVGGRRFAHCRACRSRRQPGTELLDGSVVPAMCWPPAPCCVTVPDIRGTDPSARLTTTSHEGLAARIQLSPASAAVRWWSAPCCSSLVWIEPPGPRSNIYATCQSFSPASGSGREEAAGRRFRVSCTTSPAALLTFRNAGSGLVQMTRGLAVSDAARLTRDAGNYKLAMTDDTTGLHNLRRSKRSSGQIGRVPRVAPPARAARAGSGPPES